MKTKALEGPYTVSWGVGWVAETDDPLGHANRARDVAGDEAHLVGRVGVDEGAQADAGVERPGMECRSLPLEVHVAGLAVLDADRRIFHRPDERGQALELDPWDGWRRHRP